MNKTTVCIFSLFPHDILDGKFPNKVHDPAKELYNPVYKENWKPGETLWFYNQRTHDAQYAVVCATDKPETGDGPYLFVNVIGDDTSSVMVHAKEAFHSLDALRLAFYNLPDGNTETKS